MGCRQAAAQAGSGLVENAAFNGNADGLWIDPLE
jgi:hypothetical protein